MPNGPLSWHADFIEGGGLTYPDCGPVGHVWCRDVPALLSFVDRIGHSHLGADDDA